MEVKNKTSSNTNPSNSPIEENKNSKANENKIDSGLAEEMEKKEEALKYLKVHKELYSIFLNLALTKKLDEDFLKQMEEWKLKCSDESNKLKTKIENFKDPIEGKIGTYHGGVENGKPESYGIFKSEDLSLFAFWKDGIPEGKVMIEE